MKYLDLSELKYNTNTNKQTYSKDWTVLEYLKTNNYFMYLKIKDMHYTEVLKMMHESYESISGCILQYIRLCSVMDDIRYVLEDSVYNTFFGRRFTNVLVQTYDGINVNFAMDSSKCKVIIDDDMHIFCPYTLIRRNAMRVFLSLGCMSVADIESVDIDPTISPTRRGSVSRIRFERHFKNRSPSYAMEMDNCRTMLYNDDTSTNTSCVVHEMPFVGDDDLNFSTEMLYTKDEILKMLPMQLNATSEDMRAIVSYDLVDSKYNDCIRECLDFIIEDIQSKYKYLFGRDYSAFSTKDQKHIEFILGKINNGFRY